MITAEAIHAAKILIVDDQEVNVKLLEYILLGDGYLAVTGISDARLVQELHRTHSYDAILLDLNMPHLNGFQVLEQLHEIDPDDYLPVLVVTAEPGHKLRALEAGAKDFISKPFDRLEVLNRIRNMLEVRLLYTATRDYSHHLAHYDPLTGLPNRMLFQQSLERALQQQRLAVMMMDLDHFKNINDTLGHASGDQLLRQFAQRLSDCVGERVLAGRLSGDEFALILTELPEQHEAVALAARIRNALRLPFVLDQREVNITASFGVALYPDDATDAGTLLKYADTALYRAKEAGRDACRFFTSEMNGKAQRRLELETALRKAVELQEFTLHYQPKVSLSSGRMTGAEALIRWNRPGHGLVSPAEFIPLLEETGLIVPVGTWVIDTACQQIAAWSNGEAGPLRVAVNVSSRQFTSADLEAIVANALSESGIAPDLLELEITESSLMVDVDRAIEALRKLKSGGVRISIDDFGTGYSSLAYLKRFPIDTLKIDIAFVREVTTNADDAAIVQAIIAMAHSLKLDVIAEGVETAAQLAYLARQRCESIQGYYFSKPLPAADLEQLLREGRQLQWPEGHAATPLPTLLLVDDEANVRNALQRLLRGDGYRVLTAASAAEGFEQLALHPVHVILCDQRMPNMSGTEFFDQVKDMYPNTFRIVLSGYTDIDAIMEAINRGALYRFFTKPWDNQQLGDNIRSAFKHYWQLYGTS